MVDHGYAIKCDFSGNLNDLSYVLCNKYNEIEDEEKLKTMLINLTRSFDKGNQFNPGEFFGLVEDCCDGCPSSTKYQGVSASLSPLHLIIFANEDIESKYGSYLSTDRWESREISDLSVADQAKVQAFRDRLAKLLGKPKPVPQL